MVMLVPGLCCGYHRRENSYAHVDGHTTGLVPSNLLYFSHSDCPHEYHHYYYFIVQGGPVSYSMNRVSKEMFLFHLSKARRKIFVINVNDLTY